MKKLTKRQKEIIDVSIKLISELGIQGLTIKHLSEFIGISESAIYRHYKNKLDIIMGILGYFEDTSTLIMEKIDQADVSWMEKVKLVFNIRCKEFVNNPAYAKVIFSEEIFQNDNRLSEKVTSIMNYNHTCISEFVKNAQTLGEIRNDIPHEHISTMVMGLLRVLVTRWRLNGFSFDLVDEATEYWKSIEKFVAKEARL